MMVYSFTEKLLRQGNRHFIKIPFDVWEECAQKGLIPVKVYIQDVFYECKLLPKGEGVYYIPITKSMMNQIDSSGDIRVSFEIIGSLSRINHNSPYTKENPIRKVDSVQLLTHPKDGYCGQTCIAMLAGISVDAVIDIMRAKAWQCSFSKLIETLDYFGISHDENITYTRGKEVTFPDCCIVNVKRKPRSHFVLYYKGHYYDTTAVHTDQVIGYLEISVE